jgi:glycopeptide antibiotics resistance protein
MTQAPDPALEREGTPMRSTRSWRILLGSMLAACLIVMMFIAFWPTPVDAPVHGGLMAWLDALHRAGVPTWFGYAFVESAANVLLFVPLGALIALELPRRFWWVAAVAAAVLSIVIETVQQFIPDRFASVADVIANTAGGLIGALLVWAVRRYGRPRPR